MMNRFLRRFLLLLCGFVGASASCALAAEIQPPAQSSVAAAIPYKHEPAATARDVSGSAIGAAIFVLALGGALYVIRRRLGIDRRPAGTAKQFQILETQRLGPRSALSVVQFGGARHLIAQSEQGINCLASVADPVATAADAEKPR